MKLCRYGKNGFEKPGMVDGDGRLRDLSKSSRSIGPNELLTARPEDAGEGQGPRRCRSSRNHPRLGVPYIGIGKFVAIGLKYSDHAKEAAADPDRAGSCS
jgi:hypothetical protein